MENFRPVVGYEGRYEVGDQGTVRSLVPCRGLPIPRVHKANPNTWGYLIVRLSSADHIVTTQLVHHLVLRAWHGECPEGCEGCHCDGNKLNNAADNLRWDSHESNMQDRSRHGNNNSRNSKKTHCKAGHQYTAENTYRDPRGARQCMECRRLARNRSYRKIKDRAA